MITAFAATTVLLNTAISSRNESTSTAPMKSGRRSPMYWEKSTTKAYRP
ncbi:MAG TPA: hypothetical protein VNM91_12560 [Dehalococcoidia bacterium]|nr:hypothetical protein [Dehalococcoidia bacterium]